MCAGCRVPLDAPTRACVCPVCLANIAAGSAAPWTSANVSVGVAGGLYEGILRDVIHAFKYEGRRSLADPLAGLLRQAGASVLENCDIVVPVPLHPWRRLRRGFNQSRDLAERLNRPVIHALWRVRPTASQMTLTAAARHTNVRRAFIMSPFARSVEGRSVVLIDDVRTTGATLDQCAKVLLYAGARTVCALTVASAERMRQASMPIAPPVP